MRLASSGSKQPNLMSTRMSPQMQKTSLKTALMLFSVALEDSSAAIATAWNGHSLLESFRILVHMFLQTPHALVDVLLLLIFIFLNHISFLCHFASHFVLTVGCNGSRSLLSKSACINDRSTCVSHVLAPHDNARSSFPFFHCQSSRHMAQPQ